MKALNLIIGIFCFVFGLWVMNNTLNLYGFIFLFWLSGINIGFFIDDIIYIQAFRGGARVKDF